MARVSMSSKTGSIVLQRRKGVLLKHVRTEAPLRLGATVAQANFRHPRLLGQIEGDKVREGADDGAGGGVNSLHCASLLHTTGLLVVGGLGGNVVEAEDAAIKEIHHHGTQVVLLVVDCDGENGSRVQNAPDRANNVLEIGARGAAFHKEAVGDRVEAEQTVASAAGGGEAGGDGGGEVLEGALVSSRSGGPF